MYLRIGCIRTVYTMYVCPFDVNIVNYLCLELPFLTLSPAHARIVIDGWTGTEIIIGDALVSLRRLWCYVAN